MFIPHQPYLETNQSYRHLIPRPDSPLAGIVWEVYQVDYDEHKTIIFPDICADLMVFYTDHTSVAYMAGGDPTLTTMAKKDFVSDIRSVFGVKFCTGAMGNLCMQEITDMGSCLVRGEDALTDGREMVHELLYAQSFEERWMLVFQWLKRKLNFGYEANALTNFVAQDIISNHGMVTTRDLVEETGYSERYLRLVLRERMGTTLKQLCQVTRFQWAYHLYQESEGVIPFSELSVECGYYDQSHMNNNIKKLTGSLPRNIFLLYHTSD